jgi:phosphoglycolate phosphatase
LRLIVFDLDGTLIDSRRDIADTANLLLERAGASPLPEETIGRMVGDGAAMLVARAFEAAGRPEPPDALKQFVDIYATRLLVHTRPYPGMTELIAQLAPSRSLAVLTNKPLEATRTILDGLQLSPFFDQDAVVGGDGPLGRKPEPAGLRYLMERAGASGAETLLIGDSLIDWRTARAAGADICLARYGFGFETVPNEIARQTRGIDQPQELLALY